MRTFLLTAVAAAALSAFPATSFSQVEIGPGGVRIGQPRQSRAALCQELRAACLNKEQLGEQGEGNCRRYRQTCRR
jgi:hypothetical protein